MRKEKNLLVINNLASVGIIFNKNNPTELFVEIKDKTYPIPALRGKLCFVGGNWIGDGARADRKPKDTAVREVREELSLDKTNQNSGELALLGLTKDVQTYTVEHSGRAVTDHDRQALSEIAEKIASGLEPFGDFLNTIPKSVLDSADPQNTRDGFSSLSSYYMIGLDETDWARLVQLQQAFGNLSNESVTLITSLDQIIKSGTKTAFGHDRVLQSFFLSHGYDRARQLPLVGGIISESLGQPLDLYSDYLDRYEVLKNPVNA